MDDANVGAVGPGEEFPDLTKPPGEPAQNAPNGDIGQVPQGESLSDRMARRADELEKHQSDWFEIPGFEGLLEVELRPLAWKTIRGVQKRNERIRDEALREVYNMADQVATATMGFREILPGDQHRPLEDDWMALARRMRDCPDDLSPRKAILFLVGDKRLPFLINEWGEWAKSARHLVDEEVVRDFEPTR